MALLSWSDVYQSCPHCLVRQKPLLLTTRLIISGFLYVIDISGRRSEVAIRYGQGGNSCSFSSGVLLYSWRYRGLPSGFVICLPLKLRDHAQESRFPIVLKKHLHRLVHYNGHVTLPPTTIFATHDFLLRLAFLLRI